MNTSPVLVVGVPRSGTTWVGEVLGLAPGAYYVHEPDNEKISLLGARAKRGLSRFPRISSGVPGPPALRRLWEIVGRGARWKTQISVRATRGIGARLPAWTERFVGTKERNPRSQPNGSWLNELLARAPGNDTTDVRVIKSVHSALAAEWVAEVLDTTRVVVVTRSPFAVVDSLMRLGMADAVREGVLAGRTWPGGAAVGVDRWRDAARQVGILSQALGDAAARRTGWVVISHEHLCTDPVQRYRELFDRLALPWSAAVEAGVAARNREGRGYDAQRVASREVDKWRERVSTERIHAIESGLSDVGAKAQ